MAKDSELQILDCLNSTLRDMLDNLIGLESVCRELAAKNLDAYRDILDKMMEEAKVVNKSIMTLNELEINLYQAYLRDKLA